MDISPNVNRTLKRYGDCNVNKMLISSWEFPNDRETLFGNFPMIGKHCS